MRSIDVLIVGGGPAGAACAALLAASGRSVELVDAGPRGRAKCCGDCLHPSGLAELDRLGCGDLVRSFGVATIEGEAWLATERGPRLVVGASFGSGGIAVPRTALDPLLLSVAEARGVTVRHGVRAVVGRADDDSAEVTVGGEPIRARLVIGADGLSSRVARAAGLTAARIGRKFGFALDVAGCPPHRWRTGTIAMLVGGGGYLGVVGDGTGRLHLAALLAADASAPTRPGETIAFFADRFPELAAALGPDWEGRAGPALGAGPMPWRTLRRTAPSVALVGDAAGYVEPFTGEGMGWALRSARCLVEAIVGRARFDRTARDRYEIAWSEALAARHRRTALVAALVERPRALQAVAVARSAFPRIGRFALERLVPR
jgi:flavin-dependent dehydrogenase